MVDSQIFWPGALMAASVAMFFVGTFFEFRRASRRSSE